MSDGEDQESVEPGPDQDDFSDPISTFPSVYHQQGSVAMGLDKSYVLHMAQCGEQVCAVGDTGTLSVYSLDTLTRSDTWSPHSASVTGLASSYTEPHLVYTCSEDQTVAVWDLRKSSHAAVHTLTHTAHRQKPLSCVAVNTAGLVAAGTEQVGGESFLLFWDTRAGSKLLGGYWDTHNDDITSLQFHREKKDILASGSTDGLVNVLDLSESDEDDALVTSHNAEDSVGRVVWYNSKGDKDTMNLSIQTHTEEIQLWDTDSVGPHTHLDRENFCHGIRRTVSDHTYIAGVHAMDGEDGLVVVAGSSCSTGPCVRLARIKNKKVKPMAMLGEGVGMVRCSLTVGSSVVTGGEEGIVRVWREGEANTIDSEEKTGKISKKSKVRDKPY